MGAAKAQAYHAGAIRGLDKRQNKEDHRQHDKHLHDPGQQIHVFPVSNRRNQSWIEMFPHDQASPSMFLITCLMLFRGVYAIRNTLKILDSYSLERIQNTRSNDYLYGIDFTSRGYSARIEHRFESFPARMGTYRTSRLESMRLFFKDAGFASAMEPAPECDDFHVFEFGNRYWYRSRYIVYKDFDGMEYVCADKTPQAPNRALLENFLRAAPDLDELQRAQDAMLDLIYPRIKYERVDEGDPNTRVYPIKVLDDYRPTKLPLPYSTWPYRTVIKSFVMMAAEQHARQTNGSNPSIRSLLETMYGTFFVGFTFTPKLDENVKVIRVLKHPVDTLESTETAFIGIIDLERDQQTIPYIGPKPFKKIDFTLPPVGTEKKAIVFNSFKEGEYCDRKRHYAISMMLPKQKYMGNLRGRTMDLGYTFRKGIPESLLIMNQISRFPFSFGPDPDGTNGGESSNKWTVLSLEVLPQ